ncbi:MAG: hypothetical protein HY238_02225 [Acidobacteria bacterium]|nr:hypothetical protein [Acidobacteriota bacterium]
MTEYIDVRERASTLGLLLGSELVILPRHFDSAISNADLCHEAEATTVRKLLLEAGLNVQQLQPAETRLPSAVQKSSDWIAPTVFVGSMLLTQNPYAIQVALGVLNSYLADLFKGRLSEGGVKLTLVIEQSRTKTCRRMIYEGPWSGIKDLAPLLKQLHDE